jgi:putative transposase
LSAAKPITAFPGPRAEGNDQLPPKLCKRRLLLLHGHLADRRSNLLVDHIGETRSAFRYARKRHPFELDAIVVLPDHLHAIWTLPYGDADYSLRWRLIKSAFWQRRYWEHTLRDEGDFERHADYIHFNPVKHALVPRVSDWPYSSVARMVRNGLYPQDWAGDNRDDMHNFGER